MSSTNNISDNIDAYLKGKLSAEDKIAFEAAMEKDPAFKSEVAQEKMLYAAVMEHRLAQIKTIAQEEEAALGNSSSSIKKKVIGGAIGLGIIAAIWIGVPTEKEKPEVEHTKSTSTTQKALEETPESEYQLDKKEKAASTKTISKSAVEKTVVTDTEKKEEKAIQTTTSENTKESSIDEKSPTTTDKTTSVVDCEKVAINAETSIKGTCFGKKEGSITLSQLSGGSTPYTTELYDLQGNLIPQLKSLDGGKYELVITDNNGCIQVKEINVPYESCPVDEHFNPSLGQEWQIPMNGQSGSVTILDKSGKTVWQKAIVKGHATTWDGTSANGQLPAGYYIFVITYDDGTISKGSITITE